MATDNITDKNTLKSWFKRGLKPLEAQFHAWMDAYWHKSEKIPTASIEGLEKTLNNKAESTALGEISEDLQLHKQDDVRHKTDREQGQLDHLAENPDLTYATRDELQDCETIVFHVTYSTVNGIKRYAIDSASQALKFADYFDQGKTNPVILSCLTTDDMRPESEIYSLERIEDLGDSRGMYFTKIDSGEITRAFIRMFQVNSGAWVSNLTLSVSVEKFGESEYKCDRYITMTSYDMNDFVESGGITAISETVGTETAVVGTNIPEGFTDFYGYVLGNYGGGDKRSMCCSQVVTDRIMQKTMIRSSVPDDSYISRVWTEWKEIGGSDTEVQLVTEYPTDLAPYPNGTIFIKQATL